MIIKKSTAEIEKMAAAGAILVETLELLEGKIRPGVRTADLDGEVKRALDLGATQLTDQPVEEDGFRWHILADPDGNEFCILQPVDRRSPA